MALRAARTPVLSASTSVLAVRQDQNRPLSARAGPIRDDLLVSGLSRVMEANGAPGCVRLQRLNRAPACEVQRGLTLPFMRPLAADPLQFDVAHALRNRPKGRAGLDRLKLHGIADQDGFCTRRMDLIDHPRELAGGDHPGFVNHEHIAGLETV